MTALEFVATGAVYGTAVWATHLTVGLVLNRTAAVEQSWADGVAWCRTRRTQAARVRRTAARLSRAWLLAVLRAVLPAHGKRRAGVA